MKQVHRQSFAVASSVQEDRLSNGAVVIIAIIFKLPKTPSAIHEKQTILHSSPRRKHF